MIGLFLSTPHAHTNYVDGKFTPREMIESAIAHGMSSIGFSEHGHAPCDPRCSLSLEKEEQYIARVRALAHEYRPLIKVRLGLERDRESICDRSRYEYIIGSVHYVPYQDGMTGVDGDPEKLRLCIQTTYGGDGMRFVRDYYDRLAQYVAEYKPEIIGHLDLVRKWNGKLGVFDPNDAEYRKVVCAALERMRESGAYLEVNTGAMARGYLTDPYPDLFALRYWRSLGGKAIIGTDTHHVDTVVYAYDSAVERLRDAGYESVMALSDGDALFAEYPLS